MKATDNKLPEDADVAEIGKMFVTDIRFVYQSATTRYNGNKSEAVPAHWNITAELRDDPSSYRSNKQQTMSICVEQGVGQKLVEVLLPVIIADASRKAQQLADESKAMIQALGERAIKCIADMPEKPVQGENPIILS